MKINKFSILTISLIFPTTFFSYNVASCSKSYKVDAPVDNGVYIKDTDYAKVFILSGQSNAVGVSRVEYLKNNIPSSDFETFKSGIPKVETCACNTDDLKNYIDFRPTTFSSVTDEYFGLELGFADILSKRSNQKTYVIKYAVGGTGLDINWLDSNYGRGKLYNNLVTFIKQQFAKLTNAKICGVCWMQGESDADPYHARRYYTNTEKFVSFLREDLKDFTIPNGFTFVDAGISNQWFKWDKINESKINYWKTSKLNGYFSTTENGLTCTNEPKDKPDTAHYDSVSELQLGRWFALKTIELFNNNN